VISRCPKKNRNVSESDKAIPIGKMEFEQRKWSDIFSRYPFETALSCSQRRYLHGYKPHYFKRSPEIVIAGMDKNLFSNIS